MLHHFRRVTSSGKYYPEIDGIRFIAIITVIFYHIAGSYKAYMPEEVTIHPDGQVEFNLIHNTKRGVQIFFVLSGYILSLPFLSRIQQGKNLPSLKNYYLRRLTRIEPPYLIILTAFFLIKLVSSTNSQALWGII